MRITRGLSIGVSLFAITSAIVLGFGFSVPAVDELPRCLNSTVIAIETARTPGEIEHIWKQLPDSGRRKLQGNLRADFGFMAGYGSLFVLLGLIGRRRSRSKLGVAASTTAAVLGVAAVLLDAGENVLTLGLVSKLLVAGALSADAAPKVDLLRELSLAKWASIGLTVILLWWGFRPSRRGPALYRVLAWTIASFGLVGGGLAILGLWHNTRIEMVIPLLGPALLGILPVFFSFWESHVGE